jgi:RHS repeat-associated protein
VNGNRIVGTANGSYEVDWTDALGRLALKIVANTSSTQFQYEVLNATGTYNITTVVTQSLNVAANFACPQGHSEGTRNLVTLPTSITLPNGRSFTFSYEPTPGNSANTTGRLQSATLPTRGTYQYSYQGANDGMACVPEGADVSFANQHLDQTNNLVRTVSNGSTTLTQAYTWSRMSPSTVQSTVLTSATPADSHVSSKRVVTLNGSSPVRTDQQFDSTGTSVLHTMVTTLSGGRLPLSIVSILEDGQTQSETDYTWFTTGLPLTQQDYDYGVGAHGSLLRTISHSYISGSAYVSKHIIDRVTDEIISNGAGTIVSKTHTDYDQSQFTTCPTSVPGHDDLVLCTDLIRGNPTTFTRYTDPVTPGGAIVQNRVFDWFGNLRQADADCCTQQTFNYSATTNYAYPDTRVDGPTGGPQLTTTFAYNFQTGITTSQQDPNLRTTSYQHNDPLTRITNIAYPDGGNTSYSYDDINRIITKTDTIGNSVPNRVSQEVLDSLGQSIQLRLTSDPAGTDYVDSTYDALGRLITKSNVHRSSSSPTDGISTYTYDPLSRMASVLHADGSRVSTNYVNNCTTITDEAGQSRESCADSLGRITAVWEDPGSSPHLNYETDDTYDALGNLLTVNQKGGSTNSAQWRTRTFAYDGLSLLTSATNPESGTISYTYDNRSNVLTKTAPKPNQTSTATVITTYGYDALNRLTQKSYSDGTTATVQFGYDGTALAGCTTTPPAITGATNLLGRRSSMCDASGASSWSYDVMGRPFTEKRTLLGSSALTKTTSYTYNLDGSEATLTDPSGRTITYTRSAAGRMLSAVDTANNINYTTSATYTPQGALASMVNGFTSSFAGISTTDAYNKRLQPVTLSAAAPSQTVLSLSYDFHLGTTDNGNVYQLVNNRDNNRTQNFTYDALNRIASAYTQGNSPLTTSWGETFTIDAWGNLTNKAAIAGKTNTELLNAAPATVTNRLNGFSYDAAGNTTSNGSATYTYDAENRLITTAGVTYTYDGDGARVKKSSGTLYWRGMGSDALMETDLAGTLQHEYIFFNGKRVARRDADNSVHYYFSDHLGSACVITNATGVIQEESDYYPYGGEIVITNGDPNTYKFTGKERDTESGLDDFGARYYGSSLGRFMQVDPVTVTPARQVDPQQLNLYAYVRNNPLKLVDPTGMIIDETKLSEKDLEKWQQVENLAVQRDASGNLLHPELYSEIVALQQDSRTFTLQGADGLGSQEAGRFEITDFTPNGKDFTAATIRLDFSKVSNGKNVTPAEFNLGYDKFGGLNDNARRFAELVGHEFAHGLLATLVPGAATEIQRRIDEGKDAFSNFRSTNAKAPLPPDVVQKMVTGNAASIPTERFAQQIEKVVNGELKASEHK